MSKKEDTVFLTKESLLAMTRDELMTYILSLQEIIRGVEEENFLPPEEEHLLPLEE